jgi:predicted transposase/invertase (TIGR01784 family)
MEYTSTTKRSIRLDIVAQDAQNKVFDVEIQRKDEGTGVRRARFHSSMMDRNLLNKGDKFEDLVDTYVVFITENDIFKAGLPIYHVDRTIKELNHALFQDGSHIIYVNGEFQDLEHPIGRLMHDFMCVDPSKMFNPILAEEVRYFKETEGGQSFMSSALDKIIKETAMKAKIEGRQEGHQEGRESTIMDAIQNMMSDLMISAEQAMSVMRIPEEERGRYLKKLSGC